MSQTLNDAQECAARIEQVLLTYRSGLEAGSRDRQDVEIQVIDLYADLAHYLQAQGMNPAELFARGLRHTAHEAPGWNAAHHQTYVSVQVAPVDGRRGHPEEVTDLEVAVVCHSEVAVLTPLRIVVTGRRGQAGIIHDGEELTDDKVGEVAQMLLDQLEEFPPTWMTSAKGLSGTPIVEPTPELAAPNTGLGSGLGSGLDTARSVR